MDPTVDDWQALCPQDEENEVSPLHQSNSDLGSALLHLVSYLAAKSKAQCLTKVSGLLHVTVLQISDTSMCLKQAEEVA